MYTFLWGVGPHRVTSTSKGKDVPLELDDLLTRIRSSRPSDWYSIELGTVGRRGGHSYRATYKPDVAVTVAWGEVLTESIRGEKWTQQFRHGAKLCRVELFAYGAAVWASKVFRADGRYFLPDPGAGSCQAEREDVILARLLHNLANFGTEASFDEGMRLAGFTVRGDAAPA
jgi:hypothetical protein